MNKTPDHWCVLFLVSLPFDCHWESLPDFGGLDTCHIIAGVLTTRPLLAIGGSVLVPYPSQAALPIASDTPAASRINLTAMNAATEVNKEGLEAVLSAAESVLALLHFHQMI